MARAVRITIPKQTLQALLGFALPAQVTIAHAAVRYERYAMPVLELLMVGDDLPAIFTVEEGEPILDGQMIVEHHQMTMRIEPLPGSLEP